MLLDRSQYCFPEGKTSEVMPRIGPAGWGLRGRNARLSSRSTKNCSRMPESTCTNLRSGSWAPCLLLWCPGNRTYRLVLHTIRTSKVSIGSTWWFSYQSGLIW